MTDKRMREEGAARLRMLGVMPKVAAEFKRSGTLYYSETVGFPGVLYWVSNDEWLEGKVRGFEEEYGVVVFHVVLTLTEVGRVYSFLYVGAEEADASDWEHERSLLAKGECPAWGENRDEPMFSEFGYVGVRAANGGLERVW